MSNLIYNNLSMPAHKVDARAVTNPERQWASDDSNRVFDGITDIKNYLRANTLDASTLVTIANAKIGHIDATADTSASVGPEMDFKGFNGRWFGGVDVANAPTSRDYVLTGVRGSYSFPDGATTNGSATLTSPSGGGFVVAIVGSAISGAGIPVGATIAAVAGTTSLTLSAPATATASGVQVTITRNTSQDLAYWKHRGSLSPTLGIGVTPPDGSARLQVSPQDDEPAMGTIRLRVGPTQTGKGLAIHDSTPVDRFWVDKDFYISGNHPVGGAMVVAGDTTNQRALVVTGSNKTDFYSFELPTSSGGVMRCKCVSGGVSSFDVGTDGSFRHLSPKLGFYGAGVNTKPTVTGSRGGNAALASLLIALSNLGLVTDSTTA